MSDRIYLGKDAMNRKHLNTELIYHTNPDCITISAESHNRGKCFIYNHNADFRECEMCQTNQQGERNPTEGSHLDSLLKANTDDIS